MAQYHYPTMVGVFVELAQAERVMDELQNVGISNEQIRYSVHKPSVKGIATELIALGVAQEDAGYYQDEFEKGRTVVTVRPANQQQDQKTTEIMNRYGAYNARTHAVQGTAYSTPQAAEVVQQSSQPASATTQGGSIDNAGQYNPAGEQSIRLNEEVLQTHKYPEQVGNVEVRKEIVTEQRQIDVPVTHEQVVIERHPVTHTSSTQPVGGDTDQAIKIPVTEEQVIVEKQPVVVEEITIRKQAVEETKQVTDTVQKEKAHIESEGNVDIQPGQTGERTDMKDASRKPRPKPKR